MNQFEKTIISLHGEAGSIWLKKLPDIISQITSTWDLTNLTPFENLSYNYVLSGFQKNEPVVLKISFKAEDLLKEISALEAFSGFGTVDVLAKMECALLLERAVPGNSLKDYLPEKQQDWDISEGLLLKARQLKNKLLKATAGTDVLLHGDLHHENILSYGDEWRVIDPKGVIGHPIHEVWAFIREPSADIPFVANALGFDLEAVKQWYFVHLVMAACWNVEDHLNPEPFLSLAHAQFKE